MKKRMAISVIVLLVTAATICGYFFMREYTTAQEEISEYTNIQSQYTTIINAPSAEPSVDTPTSEAEDTLEELPLYIEPDFEALLLINPDTVGWIAIPDSVISYPVVQATNNAKYLNTSFEGSRSNVGTLFADKGNDMQSLDPNTIVYGHNMGTGRTDMFSSLLLYKEYEYYMTHRYIQFDTIYERHGFWKIFAVIELDLSKTNFICQRMKFQRTADFMEWVSMAMELSIYSTVTDIDPQGYILTLSTCDRSVYGKNGRLIILAMCCGFDFTHS